MDDPALFSRGREAGLPSNLPIDGHSFRRVEVLTGAPRRRRWSAAEKAAIVAESLAPGAVASTVAPDLGQCSKLLHYPANAGSDSQLSPSGGSAHGETIWKRTSAGTLTGTPRGALELWHGD